MVFRGTDGKARQIDCYGQGGDAIIQKWDQQRRSLFKKKVLSVERDGYLYWLRMSPGCPEHNSYWTVGCWLSGQRDTAKKVIKTAFSTLQGMAKMCKVEEWTKTLSLLQ